MRNTHPLLKSVEDDWKALSSAWKNARRRLAEESVHDLRVSTRRLTASLTLLQSILGRDATSGVRRRFKRLLNRLGPLRDVQVQMSLARKWGDGAAFQGFMQSLKRREKAQSRRALQYLSDARRKELRRRLKAFEHDGAEFLAEVAPGMTDARVIITLQARRADFDGAKAGLVRSDPQSLHALRIAAKKLRYSLEAASPLLGKPPGGQLELLRRYQSDLGDIRDVQILEEELRRWATGKAPAARAAVLRLCGRLRRYTTERTRSLKLEDPESPPGSPQPARAVRRGLTAISN